MMKYLKYYIVSFLSSSVLLGIFLGGHWMWLGLAVIFVVVIGGDTVLGEDASQPEYSHPWFVEFSLHLALPFVIILLLSFAWACGGGTQDFFGIGKLVSRFFSYNCLEARGSNMWSDYIGALLGMGFMVAGYGTNVGHELTHRTRNRVAML